MNIQEKIFEAIVDGPRREGIHVTELVYDCLRKGYYAHHYGEGFFDIKTLTTFWIGKALHKTKILKHNEMTLKWNGIVGTVDDYEKGVLIDKKTTTFTPKDPWKHHIKQLEYYALLLTKNNIPFKEAHIVYINITDKKFTIFPVKIRDFETIEKEIIRKKEIFEKALKDSKSPTRKVGWLCSYCSYASVCFGDKNV